MTSYRTHKNSVNTFIMAAPDCFIALSSPSNAELSERQAILHNVFSRVQPLSVLKATPYNVLTIRVNGKHTYVSRHGNIIAYYPVSPFVFGGAFKLKLPYHQLRNVCIHKKSRAHIYFSFFICLMGKYYA